MASNGLPFLPGNTFRNLEQTKFPLSQTLTVRSETGRGAMLETDKPSMGADLVTTQKAGGVQAGTNAPGWVAFDKVCLRFDAYFQESVTERRDENFRIRKCKILFYPEDDTIQVNETVTDNSGMPQGVLIRRGPMPKDGMVTSQAFGDGDGESFFTVNDLNVGDEVTMYGRTFKITDADTFTKNFLTGLGIRVGEACETPANPHGQVLKASRAKESNAGRPYERFDTLRQFLDFDRKVLRFYVLWDDSESMFGDRRFMILHYFLADDSCELLEVLPANSGRTGNGKFFARGKMPQTSAGLVKLPGKVTERTVLNVHGTPIGGKNRHLLDSLRTGATTDKYYSDADFQIGSTFECLGRGMLVCDCDDFTRSHYKSKFDVDLGAALDVEVSAPPAAAPRIPPSTGYGTEEDSMVSVEHLVLQQPKKIAGAYLPPQVSAEDGSMILRFSAVLTSKADTNEGRKFIISYYVEDDTIGIYEMGVRNSGIRHGKFLQRGRYMCADGSRRLELRDLAIGSTIAVQHHEFVIDGADEYCINYLRGIGL
jgi:hypothetical protein